MNKLVSKSSGVRRFIFVADLQKSPFILLKQVSSFAQSNSTINGHLQNPFAEFAITKFNLSHADIAHMFKNAPHLQRLQTLESVEEFVGMLKKQGCKQDQIAMIMRRHPRILTTSVVSVVQPKLQLLKNYGIDGEHLAKVLTSRPLILSHSLERELIPTMTLLQNAFQSQHLLVKAVIRAPTILTCNLNNTLKSLAFWEGFGFRGTELAEFLLVKPTVLRFSSLSPAKVDLIHKIGLDKGSKMYKYVLSLVTTYRIETLESKIRNLQLCGLSKEETMELLRVSPYILALSEERVRQNMDFILRSMKLPANSVVRFSFFLTISVEKVLKPRFLILQKMESMDVFGHSKDKVSPQTIMGMSEAEFVRKIIEGHPESPILHAFYKEATSNVSSCTRISRKAFVAISKLSSCTRT